MTAGASTAAQLTALAAGDLDVGLVRELPGEPALRAVQLLDTPVGVALPRGHRLAAADAVEPAALSGETMVWFPAAMMPGFRDRVLDALTAAGFVPGPSRESPDTETSLGLVAAGLGLSIKLRDQVLRHGRAGAPVVWRPLAGVAVRSRVWALARRSDEVLPAQFLDTAAAEFGLPDEVGRTAVTERGRGGAR